MAETAPQDRTEEASARRLEQAREQGQVPRSRELVNLALIGGGALGVFLLGSLLTEVLARMMHSALLHAATASDRQLPGMLGESLGAGAWAVLPLIGLLAVLAIGASLAVGGWNFTLKGLEWRAERLDPLKGLARLFSSHGLIETLKGLLKVGLIGGIGFLTFHYASVQLPALALSPLAVAVPALVGLGLKLWAALAASMALIALLDVPMQRWQHARGLRMTREELREEHKDIEGRPEVRARIRQLQRERSRRRMMEQVPKADVVLINPIHYAVALRYDAERMRAPVVVAKGLDRVALRIGEIAREHGIPVLESPPLARALYRHGELDQPIPMDLYRVVAQVLAYVYQLKRWPGQPLVQPSFSVPDAYAVTGDVPIESSATPDADSNEFHGAARE